VEVLSTALSNMDFLEKEGEENELKDEKFTE